MDPSTPDATNPATSAPLLTPRSGMCKPVVPLGHGNKMVPSVHGSITQLLSHGLHKFTLHISNKVPLLSHATPHPSTLPKWLVKGHQYSFDSFIVHRTILSLCATSHPSTPPLEVVGKRTQQHTSLHPLYCLSLDGANATSCPEEPSSTRTSTCGGQFTPHVRF